MEEGLIVCLLLVLGGAVALLRRYFTDARAVREELEAAPRTPIERAATGAVCIKGKVGRHTTTTIAPLSRRTCLAWVITVRMSGNNDLLSGDTHVAQTCDFWIVDDTGRALVETTEPVKIVSRRTTTWSPAALSSEREDALEKILREHDVWSWTMEGNPFMSYEEGTLEEGDIATVVGHAAREPHVDGQRHGLREPPTIARIRTGGPKDPLLISSDG